MILPRPLPEIRFTDMCYLFPLDDIRPWGDIHVHIAEEENRPIERFVCIRRDSWRDLSETMKWFILFHESFHTTQDFGSYNPVRPHYLQPNEWEADWYACRIFASFGYDLRKLSREHDIYRGRPLYMPFSAEYITYREEK